MANWLICLMGLEQRLYGEAAGVSGGWSGWRGFTVQRKVRESDEITFHLTPADGGGCLPTDPVNM